MTRDLLIESLLFGQITDNVTTKSGNCSELHLKFFVFFFFGVFLIGASLWEAGRGGGHGHGPVLTLEANHFGPCQR